jgi:hypothetical protein
MQDCVAVDGISYCCSFNRARMQPRRLSAPLKLGLTASYASIVAKSFNS